MTKERVLTINVTFTCETCKMTAVKELRLGASFSLGADQMPPGWTAAVDYGNLLTWCPICSLKR